MKKRTTSMILALFVFLSLCACGTPSNVESTPTPYVKPTPPVNLQKEDREKLANSTQSPEPTQTAVNDTASGYYTGQEYILVEGGYEYTIGKEGDSVQQLDIELRDNSCTYYRDHKMTSGSWSYSKDTIYVSVPGKFDAYGTLTNGVLYLHDCPKEGYDTILFKDGVEINEADIPGVYHPSLAERAFLEARNIDNDNMKLLPNGNAVYESNTFFDRAIILDTDFIEYKGKATMASYSALYNSWVMAAGAIIADRQNEHDSELSVISATVGIIPKEERTSKLERLSNFCSVFSPMMESEALIDRLISKGVITNYEDSDTKDTIEYDIPDLSGAAELLGTTQRFLGYTISHIGGAADFKENSVHVTIYKHTND